MKRLYRNTTDVMIAGVASGIGKYLGVDPTAIRLAFVLLLFVGLGGLWIYLVLWIIMPVEPAQGEDGSEVKADPTPTPIKKVAAPKKTPAKKPSAKRTPEKKPAAKQKDKKVPGESPTAEK